MKKGMAAGILLVLLCSGCTAKPAQNAGIGLESQNPAETVMMKDENSLNAALPSHEDAATAMAGKETTVTEITSESAASHQPEEDAAADTPSGLLEQETATAALEGFTPYADGFSYEPINDEVKQRIYGLSYKEDCTVPYEELRYVKVRYIDFDGLAQDGELICNKGIAQDLVEIFYELYQASYPIEKIRLIDEYNADDDLSCLDNNTSCFNYRVVGGSSSLSKHALGLAIDINPFYNPYVTYPNGVERISPPGSEPYADRSQDFPYKIDENDLCYQLFTAHGFTWGGHWKTLKDYQHFQKAL